MAKEVVKLHDRHFELIITEEEVQKQVARLAAELNALYQGAVSADSPLHLLTVEMGALAFLHRLRPLLKVPVVECFTRVKSYEGAESTGQIQVLKRWDRPLKGMHVVVVEDIVDTGLTMCFLLDQLRKEGASSVAVCAMVLKPERFGQKLEGTKVLGGFSLGNDFIVGEGLDYDQLGRQLKGIYRTVDI